MKTLLFKEQDNKARHIIDVQNIKNRNEYLMYDTILCEILSQLFNKLCRHNYTFQIYLFSLLSPDR